MPFGTGWLVDVRDYFLRVPEAMIIAIIMLHYLIRKFGKKEENNQKN